MIISAIDPGVTTGFAYADLGNDPSFFDVSSPDHFFLSVFPDINGLIDKLIELRSDLVVIEDFNTAGTLNRERKITIMTIGAVLATQRWLNKPVVTHVPQHRRAYLSQAHSLYPKAIIHSIDALAHLLCAIDLKEYRRLA